MGGKPIPEVSFLTVELKLMKFDLFHISYIAVWALVLFQGFLTLALLRRLEELRDLVKQSWGGEMEESLRDDDFLPVGSRAPEFAGLDARSGKPIGIHNLDGGGALLFLSSECRLCRGLAESLGQYPLNGLPPIIAVCRGEKDAATFFGKRLSEDISIMSEGAEETARLYHVSNYPTSVVIGPARTVRAYGQPNDVESLRDLLERSLSEDSTKVVITANLTTVRSEVSQ